MNINIFIFNSYFCIMVIHKNDSLILRVQTCLVLMKYSIDSKMIYKIQLLCFNNQVYIISVWNDRRMKHLLWNGFPWLKYTNLLWRQSSCSTHLENEKWNKNMSLKQILKGARLTIWLIVLLTVSTTCSFHSASFSFL